MPRRLKSLLLSDNALMLCIWLVASLFMANRQPPDFLTYLNAAQGEMFTSYQDKELGYYYPHYFLPLFYLFTLPSFPIALSLWYLLNLLALKTGSRLMGGNPYLALFNPYTAMMLSSGQPTGLLVLGVGLLWRGFKLDSARLGGAGIVLISMKPAWGVVLMLWYVAHTRKWQALLLPASVFLASVVLWGNWVFATLQRIHATPPLANASLSLAFGVYVMVLLLPSLLMDRHTQFDSLLASFALALPYFFLTDWLCFVGRSRAAAIHSWLFLLVIINPYAFLIPPAFMYAWFHYVPMRAYVLARLRPAIYEADAV